MVCAADRHSHRTRRSYLSGCRFLILIQCVFELRERRAGEPFLVFNDHASPITKRATTFFQGDLR
jgi:hypothetical protein